MAGKRSASSDLNHDNWDQDDDPEDAGVFERASEEALKNRVIKTARRRNPISSVRESENKSVFSGFSFQGTSSTEKSSGSGFAFLNNLQKKAEASPSPKTNGTNFGKDVKSTSVDTNEKPSNYYSRLKGLNESVAKWVKAKVEENPIVSLLPIFKDYEKYLTEIEKQKVDSDLAKIDTAPIATFSFSAMPAPDSTSEKSSLESKKTESEEKKKPIFSFGVNNSASPIKNSISTATTTATAPTFSFGTGSSTTKPAFSFGASTAAIGSSSTPTPSFSFGSSTTTPFSNNLNSDISKQPEPAKQEEDDEDSPPKVEIVPVVEKDHIYTIRCKVFIKKGDNFGNGSVGNLFLKPIEGSEKVQLVVRADTNLGNLLCNFILAESIPTKRLGKKDVMLVCVPTADAKPPPVPVLLRVKSAEEADELLNTLEKHKK